MMQNFANCSNEVFTKFLNYVFLIGSSDKQIASHTSSERITLLRNLVSLFFVDTGNDDWINCGKV